MGLPLTLTHVMPQSCTELKNSAMHYQNLAPPQRCVDIQWWTPSVIKATGNRFGALAILQQITFRFRQYFLPLNLWSRLSNRSKHSKQTKMRWNFGHHWGTPLSPTLAGFALKLACARQNACQNIANMGMCTPPSPNQSLRQRQSPTTLRISVALARNEYITCENVVHGPLQHRKYSAQLLCQTFWNFPHVQQAL